VAAIPVVLVTTNIRFLSGQAALYDYSVEAYDAASIARIPQSELERANRELIDYFRDDDQRNVRIIVEDDQGQSVSLFSAREVAHLADVKVLFGRVFFVQEATIGYILGFLALVVLWARELTSRQVAALMVRAGLLTFGLVLAVAVAAFVGFESLWERFHSLAFSNDFWLLNPRRDHLIQMFPEEFWFDASLLIGLVTALEALLVAGFGGIYLYVSQPAVASHDSQKAARDPESGDRLGDLARVER